MSRLTGKRDTPPPQTTADDDARTAEMMKGNVTALKFGEPQPHLATAASSDDPCKTCGEHIVTVYWEETAHMVSRFHESEIEKVLPPSAGPIPVGSEISLALTGSQRAIIKLDITAREITGVEYTREPEPQAVAGYLTTEAPVASQFTPFELETMVKAQAKTLHGHGVLNQMERELIARAWLLMNQEQDPKRRGLWDGS